MKFEKEKGKPLTLQSRFQMGLLEQYICLFANCEMFSVYLNEKQIFEEIISGILSSRRSLRPDLVAAI